MACVGIGVKFPCPECGLEVVVQSGNESVVLHPYPLCERYNKLETCDDAADYIRDARLKLAPETLS